MTQVYERQEVRLQKSVEVNDRQERPRGRFRFQAMGRHLLLIIVSLIFFMPFYWMLSAAFKDDGQIFSTPIKWWPDPIHWNSLIQVWNDPGFPYLQLLGNSIFYAGMVALGTVISCAAAAYSLARLRYPGRNVLFVLTVATLMVPSIVTFIPTYVLFKYTGLIGSYAPLIIPAFLGNGFFIFMLRQFFLTIPWELSEAAKMDGASEFRIFWQIMLPLVRPALIVVAVFSILYTWQDFFGPLIYLSDTSQYPLSLGLFAFQGQRATDWPALMMGSVLTMLPLIVIFAFAQRYFLEGITMTGMKG
ncbi:carbohydrate ABC transporter permease [Ktedonosporobacter rubrisoli]|uniref:Carbohydrate ABC transporter permease n=1 Tax=Ktedonosporobacter rubrisoli TaxID=2509675 RepID=A0A4P6JPE5_KTERU|nr:carbohydrate ABC transporter permease [Ktedonosporobacter rubrisoli]QBD77145.1 carbohydrate ABC transporter permease [Ktedonosporobacter rubrisoli]